MSAQLEAAVDAAVSTLEALPPTAWANDQGDTLRAHCDRLSSLRADQAGSVALQAEAALVEAACRLLLLDAEPDQAGPAMELLDGAVGLVARKWPALRLSVLQRALALAAPLTRPEVATAAGLDATVVEATLRDWAASFAEARTRQLELRAQGAADLATAQHLADRLDRLDAAQAARVRGHAIELASQARLTLAFAGEAGLSARAAELAREAPARG